jgi:hypothetical protein
VNGDNVPDFILGSNGTALNISSYLFYGGSYLEKGANYQLNSISSYKKLYQKVVIINGGPNFGYSVSGGDVNGDRYADLLLSVSGNTSLIYGAPYYAEKELFTPIISPSTKALPLCPSGSISVSGNIPCDKCAIGQYQSSYNTCSECPYPTTSYNAGSFTCDGFTLDLDPKVVNGICAVFILFYVIIWYFADSLKFSILVSMLLPMIDHVTDVKYLLIERFFSTALFFVFLIAVRWENNEDFIGCKG